jgi:hypothetical protein
MPRLLVCAVVLAAFVGAPAFAGTANNAPTCARELATAEVSLTKTLLRLKSVEKASADLMCAAFRDHAGVVAKAREVFSRCASERDRALDVGQMDKEILRTEFVLTRQCKGQEPKPTASAASSS